MDSLNGSASRDGEFTSRVIVVASFLWLGIQLWTSVPYPWVQYTTGIWKLNETEQRSLHFGFALFLAFLALRSTGPISRRLDWVLAVLGAFAGSYLFLFYDALAARPRAPTDLDILVAAVGFIVLVEAVRRVFGRLAALVFVASSLAALIGSAPITSSGISKFLRLLWISTEGTYGIPMGQSTHLSLLCLMLGAVADRLGFAGQLPHRFVGWLNSRRAPHKTPLVVPEAFDGHLAKWIMAFVVFWELLPGVVPWFRGPLLLSTMLHVDLGLLLAFVAVSLSVFFQDFILDSQGHRITKRDPHGRLLVWWGCLIACVGFAAILFPLSDLAVLPLAFTLEQRPNPDFRIAWPLAAAALFALGVWARSAKPETVKTGRLAALSFWLPWVVFAWFNFAERTSPGQAAFWTSLASLMIVVIAFAFGTAGDSEPEVRQTSLAAGLKGLSLAVVDAARATAYVAIFAAFWGVLIFYFVAWPG